MNKIIQEDLARIAAAPLPWEVFAGARVLITGGAGFLPAYMAETLLYLNREGVLFPAVGVYILARNEERARARFSDYVKDSNLCIDSGDVSSRYIPPIFDYIIHAAAQASPVFYRTDPIGTLTPNSLGTYRMLDVARFSQSRSFLFFSSGDAVFNLNPLELRSCYGESKRMGEAMCAAFAHQHHVPAKIVRISHTYGPGMRLDDGRVFADFTRDILNGGPIVLHSDGLAKRPFTYLADATIAFFTVLLEGNVAEAYTMANPSAYVSIRDLADRLGQEFGLKVVHNGRGVGSHSSVYVPAPASQEADAPDISKLQALGWSPTTGVEEGFRRTVESYR